MSIQFQSQEVLCLDPENGKVVFILNRLINVVCLTVSLCAFIVISQVVMAFCQNHQNIRKNRIYSVINADSSGVFSYLYSIIEPLYDFQLSCIVVGYHGDLRPVGRNIL